MDNEAVNSEAPSTQLSEQDVNELYEKIQQPTSSANIPMTQEESYELSDGVKVNKDELLDYARQGYNYKQNPEQNLSDEYKQYAEVDTWAKQNPDQWKHILESYNKNNLTDNVENNYNENENVTEETNLQENISPELQPILSQINDISTKLRTIEGRFDLAKRQEEDDLLDQEITFIKDKYKDLDFKTPDDNGETLEHKVLKHAQDLGVNSFQVAFKDLMHDKLLERAKSKGMETIQKEIERKTKLGLLGESKKSVLKLGKTKSTRGKSYDDLLNEGLEELGLN